MRILKHLVGVALVVTVLSGCRDHNRWQQKLTVEVETPKGRITGASVVGVDSWFGQLPASGNEVNYEVTGEATVVELGSGRYLFALLGGSEERFYRTFETRGRNRGRDLDRIARMQGETRILKPENYPLLVTFADISNPVSVKRVDPDDLDAAFGCHKTQMAEAFPWRGQGKTWRAWQSEQAYERALNTAGPSLGFSAYLSDTLVELHNMRRAHPDLTEEQQARVTVLRSRYTSQHIMQWDNERRKLQAQFTLAKRDTSHDCHSLKSITIEITDEPVTKGEVEKVLPCLMSGRSCVPLNESLPYGHPMRNIKNSDFWR